MKGVATQGNSDHWPEIVSMNGTQGHHRTLATPRQQLTQVNIRVALMGKMIVSFGRYLAELRRAAERVKTQLLQETRWLRWHRTETSGKTMVIALSTALIAPDDRVEWWRDRVKQLFGTGHAIIPTGHDPFSFEIMAESTDRLRLVSVSGTAHQAIGACGNGPASVMVRLQLMGHITLRADGRESQVTPSTLTLLPLRSAGNLTFHDNFRHVSFIVSEEDMTAVFPLWSRMAMMPLDASSGMTALLANHMRAMAAHPDALVQAGVTVSDFTLSLLGAVLSHASRGVVPASSRLRAYHLERAQQYIRTHLCRPDLDVSQVAGAIGVSVRYLHQLFSDASGSVMHWVQQERLARCRALLSNEPKRSVSDIAYAGGFSDHAHFARSFRKAFGLSPSEARNRVAQPD
jgi:AraC-like DNA-binding protein